MGLFDFLTQPRQSVHSGGLLAPVGPNDQPLQQAPVMEQKPSLLSEAAHFLTSPRMLAAIGAGVNGLAGDDSGVQVAMQLGQQRRQQEAYDQAQAQKRAAIAAKNAALKAAYKPDANGKMRFDPAAYVAALAQDGNAEADLGELANLHNALAPKAGVSGDTPYTIDDQTGEVTWGEERPWSRRDQEAADKTDEAEQMRRLMYELAIQKQRTAERQGDERIGLARQREGRVAAGRGGGGGGVPPLPPGFVVEK